MMWWWSWLLTAIGCLGLWVAGSKRQWGWLINLGGQSLWLTYAIVTEQYGFIASAFLYGFVYWRNWRRWKAEAEQES